MPAAARTKEWRISRFRGCRPSTTTQRVVDLLLLPSHHSLVFLFAQGIPTGDLGLQHDLGITQAFCAKESADRCCVGSGTPHSTFDPLIPSPNTQALIIQLLYGELHTDRSSEIPFFCTLFLIAPPLPVPCIHTFAARGGPASRLLGVSSVSLRLSRFPHPPSAAPSRR